jgi:hypothetical protein
MPEADPPEPASSEAAPEPRTVIIGVISAPGTSTELAERLRPDLTERIGARLPGVRWVVRFVSDRLVDGPADLSQLISAARRRLIDEQWHLTVCVTDLPLQTARRPVAAHASMTHGVAVLSLPALGAVGVTRRAADALVRLVAALVGDADRANLDAHATTGTRGRAHADVQGRRGAVTRRLQELGDAVAPDSHGFGLVAGVITGNLRLLLGMLRANRPWRLAIRLSRALVAALTAAVFALVTSDIWRLADGLGPIRLALLTVGSVAGVVLTDRPRHGSVGTPAAHRLGPGQVIMFNLVTLATVVIGALALYGTLLVLNLVGAFLLVPRQSLTDGLGHKASVASMAGLAWLATSIATVGGALGAGLETDEAVREAAYGYQADAELSR